LRAAVESSRHAASTSRASASPRPTSINFSGSPKCAPVDYFRANGFDRGDYVNLVRSLDD
jgi:hypothetical protein